MKERTVPQNHPTKIEVILDELDGNGKFSFFKDGLYKTLHKLRQITLATCRMKHEFSEKDWRH